MNLYTANIIWRLISNTPLLWRKEWQSQLVSSEKLCQTPSCFISDFVSWLICAEQSCRHGQSPIGLDVDRFSWNSGGGCVRSFWFSCNSSGRFSQNWLVSALRRKLVAQSWFTPQFLGRCPYHRFFKPSSLKYIQELSLASKEYLELKHMLTRVICSDQWKRRPFHTTIFSQVHANPRGVNSQLSKASEIQTKMAGLQLNKSSLFSKKKVSTSEVEGWKPGRATTWFQTSGLTHNFRYQTRFCFKN